LLSRVYEREERLADILDLPYGEQDVDLNAAIDEHSAIVDNISDMAGKMVESFDERGSMTKLLEQARVPVRPGEFVVIVASMGVVLGAFVAAVTARWLLGVAAFAAVPFLAKAVLKFLVKRRKRKFEEQFPDALGLIASSLSAGHTFLRSIQMMTEEAEAPLSEEFARVVNETALGDPLVDSLERMAQRLEIRDVEWVVQAIRIQQAVGGKLADLLHTLADFIRAREEIRREVLVLTAEGRISAWVLAAMPVFLLMALSSMNPEYMAPMFKSWGLLALALCGVSIGIGFSWIMKMAKVEV
jgi:tight adherence protein B